MVVFEECNAENFPGVSCKSKEAIQHFLNYRYIVTLENRKDFIQHKFGKYSISKKAEIRWYPFVKKIVLSTTTILLAHSWN